MNLKKEREDLVDKVVFKKRVITSALVALVVVLTTFLLPNWAFSILAAIFVGFAIWEFFDIVERHGISVYKYVGTCIGVMVPIMTYLQKGVNGYSELEPFTIFIACLFIFVLQFTKRDNSQALLHIAITVFGLLYIAWFMSFFVRLKMLPNGTNLVLFLILVTKMGDIGAYLVGNAFGKNPLIPRISPKKTVEGTMGGLVFSFISAVVSKCYMSSFSFAHLAVLGVLLGILGQVGDLAESILKRDCGVKDSGKGLPGFGGVMDLIDSLLFTAPIFYFYMMVLLK